jgi:hypothetical protein
VDCRWDKDRLRLYVYGEDEGDKGGNNVGSLIMKFLEEGGLLDGLKRKKFNIIMDNCSGQNKNRHILRLALYLVHKGHFEYVKFMSLVVGHTKNVADRLFNIAKILYRKLNILYTLSMLSEAFNTAEQVDCCIVDHTEFRDWETFVSKFAKDKLDSVKMADLQSIGQVQRRDDKIIKQLT